MVFLWFIRNKCLFLLQLYARREKSVGIGSRCCNFRNLTGQRPKDSPRTYEAGGIVSCFFNGLVAFFSSQPSRNFIEIPRRSYGRLSVCRRQFDRSNYVGSKRVPAGTQNRGYLHARRVSTAFFNYFVVIVQTRRLLMPPNRVCPRKTQHRHSHGIPTPSILSTYE